MFIITKTRDYIHHDMSKNPSLVKTNEKCNLCHREIPDDKLVVRHTDTKEILCLICLLEMAYMTTFDASVKSE